MTQQNDMTTKLNDAQTRLVYAAISHLTQKNCDLPEFTEIRKNTRTQWIAEDIYWKLSRYQTNKTDVLLFTDTEWDICRRAIACETKLLEHMDYYEDKEQSTEKIAEFKESETILYNAMITSKTIV